MRARNLKPAIFKNEVLAKLGPWHLILFEGLWCLADREGRLEDRPERIEAEIFPFKFQKVDITTLLQGLAEAYPAFIIRYQRDQQTYIQVVNFKGHQRPHINEEESKIPPVPKTERITKVESACNQGNDHLLPRRPDSLSSDSPSLTPSSLTPDVLETPLAPDPKKHGPEPPMPVHPWLIGLDLYTKDKKLMAKIWDVDKAWMKAFPGIDIGTEIRKAHAWELANPDRQKKNRIKFFNTWLSRAQDRPRAASPSVQSPSPAISEFELQVRKVHGLPIPGMENQHASDGSQSVLSDQPIPRGSYQTKGLRKAGFQGPAGALLSRIRNDQGHADTAKKSDVGSGGADGNPVV